jgi:ribonucleoside-diphosphate reductase alpha chain
LANNTAIRNAQTTVIAPTGTIGLVMDCDTTGIEPDFALVKFKKLAGGGYFKIINQSVPAALETLGYSTAQAAEIVAHAVGHASLGQAPGINHTALIGHGFGPREIEKIEAALPSAFDIKFVFNQWTLGADFCTGTLGIPEEKAGRPDLRPPAPPRLYQGPDRRRQRPRLRHDDPGRRAAPEARTLPVFDCANPCGKTGKRFLSVNSHIT